VAVKIQVLTILVGFLPGHQIARMRVLPGRPGRDEKMKWVGLIVIILIVVGAGLWVAIVKFESEKPSVHFLMDSQYVGQNLTFRVEDQKSGVAEVQVEVVQQGKTTVLLLERFPKGTNRVEKTIPISPLPPGLKNGEAQVRIVFTERCIASP
jgi:hypothetical protein